MVALYLTNFTLLSNSYTSRSQVYRFKPYVDPASYTSADAKKEVGSEVKYYTEHGDVAEAYPTCNIAAMDALKSVLDIEANRVMSIWTEDEQTLVGYYFQPAVVQYSVPYPHYAQIAKELPSHIHYFQKFPDVNFPLVTQSFVDCVKENNIRGLSFPPKFDGKKVLGIKCKV